MVMVLPGDLVGWSPEVTYVPFKTKDPIGGIRHMLLPAVILGISQLSAITMRLTRTMDA